MRLLNIRPRPPLALAFIAAIVAACAGSPAAPAATSASPSPASAATVSGTSGVTVTPVETRNPETGRSTAGVPATAAPGIPGAATATGGRGETAESRVGGTSTPSAGAQSPSPSPTQDGPNADALAQRAWVFLKELTAEHSPRASATDKEASAAEYLAGVYRSLGYETTIQSFEVSVLVTDPSILRVARRGESANATPAPSPDVDAQPLRLSAETTAHGPLSHVGLVLGDLPAGSLAGRVALIERGLIPFELKVSRVTNAGAVAAVIYNNEPGQFGGTLTTQARIPAVSVSQEAGQELLKLASGGDVEATVTVAYEGRQSRNVIAEKKGTDPSAGAVILGGHFDTVPDVPGANDNGSGVATLLAIAESIVERDYPFTVRFIDFGSEELGLRGSQHYLTALSPEERRAIVAMLNFDALGTGVAGVYGTDALANRALSVASGLGLELARAPDIQGGSSDFASFEAAGIPFLFFLASDFSRIHTAGDTLDHIDREDLGTAAAVAPGVLDRIAGLSP